MTDSPPITLLTDFGLKDGYAGILKGTIARIAPMVRTIDITHEIPTYNIRAASFCLKNAYSYFPRGTVHLAVVDPGVGSGRRGVAVRIREGYLVGPDNGLFSGVFDLSPPLSAVSLTVADYWLTPVPSSSFHGRDIFAPVAAHLAGGVPLEILGETIDPDSLIRLRKGKIEVQEGTIAGVVEYIDIFGNIITDLNLELAIDSTIDLEGTLIPYKNTYSDVPPGTIVAFRGSHGYLEIALNGGSARNYLELNAGETIGIIINPPDVGDPDR